jgi:hypothetical protein
MLLQIIGQQQPAGSSRGPKISFDPIAGAQNLSIINARKSAWIHANHAVIE